MGLTGAKFDLSEFPRRISTESEGLVDLTRAQFVDPYGLVGIACVIADVAQRREVHVRLPRSENVSNYLARMGFETMLEHPNVRLDHPLPRVTKQDHSDFLLELQRFDDTFSAEAVANLIYTRLSGQVDGAMLEKLHESVGELGNNVDEHSGSAVGGFVAAQTYQRHQADEYLIVAVGDPGIGLRASLERMHTVDDDMAAIELALQKDVTGTEQRGRGQGLYYFTDFARQCGWASVQSGHARKLITAKERRERVNHFKGTLIGMRLRCKR